MEIKDIIRYTEMLSGEVELNEAGRDKGIVYSNNWFSLSWTLGSDIILAAKFLQTVVNTIGWGPDFLVSTLHYYRDRVDVSIGLFPTVERWKEYDETTFVVQTCIDCDEEIKPEFHNSDQVCPNCRMQEARRHE